MSKSLTTQASKLWTERELAVLTSEELAELIQPLLQLASAKRRPNQRANIREEMVDVQIMLEILGPHLFVSKAQYEKLKAKKLRKLARKIKRKINER